MAPLIVGWAGLFLTWAGASGIVIRRYIADNYEPWGEEREFWMRAGFFVPPEWFSRPLLAAGLLLLVVWGVLELVT